MTYCHRLIANTSFGPSRGSFRVRINNERAVELLALAEFQSVTARVRCNSPMAADWAVTAILQTWFRLSRVSQNCAQDLRLRVNWTMEPAWIRRYALPYKGSPARADLALGGERQPPPGDAAEVDRLHQALCFAKAMTSLPNGGWEEGEAGPPHQLLAYRTTASIIVL